MFASANKSLTRPTGGTSSGASSAASSSPSSPV